MSDSNSTRIGFFRTLFAAGLLLAFPSAASAHGAKWELRDVVFDVCEPNSSAECRSGGQATGYVVLTDGFQPVDWAIHVSGSVDGAFEPFLYDSTNSTARTVGGLPDSPRRLVISAPGEGISGPQRRLTLPLSQQMYFPDTIPLGGSDEALEPQGLFRTMASPASRMTTDFAPVLSLKVNGLRPTTRIVPADGRVRLTLDVLPSAWTGAFTWYWAIVAGDRVYWVTSSGLSSSAAPFATQVPEHVTDGRLVDALFPPGVYTHVVYLMQGSTLVSADWITAHVGG